MCHSIKLGTQVVFLAKTQARSLSIESGFRILKYHLKGAKKGQSEVLLRTPGLPDNLVAIGKDRYVCTHRVYHQLDLQVALNYI